MTQPPVKPRLPLMVAQINAPEESADGHRGLAEVSQAGVAFQHDRSGKWPSPLGSGLAYAVPWCRVVDVRWTEDSFAEGSDAVCIVTNSDWIIEIVDTSKKVSEKELNDWEGIQRLQRLHDLQWAHHEAVHYWMEQQNRPPAAGVATRTEEPSE